MVHIKKLLILGLMSIIGMQHVVAMEQGSTGITFNNYTKASINIK